MKKILTIALLSLLAFSCRDDNQPSRPSNRTILVYMAADNNLYPFAIDDINELEKNWNDGYDGNILVYMNPRSSTIPARLYRITKGIKSEIESEVIKDYGVKQNACDPAVLAQVIADTRSLSKSNSYAMVLWSHGTGWIPKAGVPVKSTVTQSANIPPVSYSFGVSDIYNDQMNIDQLKTAMPSDLVFDFIAFDACYMASIEVAYTLRNSTKLLMASAAETFASGFEYDNIIVDMMGKQADVVSMARKTFESFDSEVGLYRTSTMSVIDCSKLSDLAVATRDVVTTKTPTTLGSPIQEFGVKTFRGLYYDLADFINKTWAGTPALANFNEKLKSAVIYQATTPWIFSDIEVKTHCGITAFIPKKSQPKNLDFFINNTEWSKDSGLDKILF